MIKQSAALAAFGFIAWPAIGHAVPTSLHAKAWTDMGKIVHSTDTLQVNYNGNWQQSIGMQFHGTAQLSEHWEGGLGFGLSQNYHSSGSQDEEKFTLSKYVNYVSEARVSYAYGEDKANPAFAVDLGNFAFNYNPNVKNLGLYLFRGPVYPGFLVSGFKEFHTDTTRAAFLGARFHHGMGNFRQDLILSSERDLPPSFDWSLGYLARYKALDAIEIGAGANFYHLFAENADITDPNRGTANGLFNKEDALYADTATKFHPYNLQYYEVIGGDTTLYTHRGIKVMGMASIDIKRLLGLEAPFGEKDLRLYGEAALIGVKNYGTIYAKRSERVPFMVGFNLPTFGILDFLSIEYERYPARYKADYSKLGYDRSLYFKNIAPPKVLTLKNPSAIPISAKDLADEKYTILANGDFVNTQSGDTIQVKGTDLDPENMTADDVKWSVNLEKTVAGHVQFSGQIANDHFVARPVRNGLITEAGGMSEVLTSMKDWYFMFRIGYFF